MDGEEDVRGREMEGEGKEMKEEGDKGDGEGATCWTGGKSTNPTKHSQLFAHVFCNIVINQ